MGSQAADPPDRGPLEIKGLPRDIIAPSERDRLLQAMAETCAERGYEATSIEEVIARAGVSRRSFAQNFTGKEECAIAAVNQILADTSVVASASYTPDSSEWESILRGVRALLELMAARPSFARLAYVQARHAMPPEAYELYASGARVLSAMLDRLRVDAAGDAPRPPSAARGALGSAEALVTRELVAGRAERLPQLLPDIIYGALVPFLDQREALRYAGLARELLNNGG